MSADELDLWLSRLENVRQTGPDRWEASCPLEGHAHGDRNRSLSIAVGGKRPVVATCHAFAEHTFEALRDRLGIDGVASRSAPRSGLFARVPDSPDREPLPDAADLERYTRTLLADKHMLAEMFEAKGWTAGLLAALGVGLKGARLLIPVHSPTGELVTTANYGPGATPKMRAAKGHPRAPLYLLRDDDLQLWVEGEADAVSGAALGCSTVGIPGAGSQPRPEWLEPARGRRVVLSLDDDDPGARAEAVWAPALAAVARELVVVHSPVGKDIGDFVREHRHDLEGARRAWLELVAAAAPWQAAAPIEPEPTDEPDDTSIGRIRRVLFEDTASTRDGSDVVREPVPGTGGLLWRGIAHSIFGDRGEGKSVTVVIATVAAAAVGERVLYLDRENGPSLMRSIVEGVLEAHDDWPDVLESGAWTGRHYPAFSREWEPADYAEAIAGRGYTGVIYDSVREVISELGGNPNADEDISTLTRILVTPLIRRGLWVVLLDNVGHVEKGRPKGAGSKLDATPIGYQVRTTVEFGPDEEGAAAVKCTRSRYGDLGREWVVRVGAGRFDVPEARDGSPDERAAHEAEERYEGFARRVVDELSRNGPLGRKTLLERVKGARKQTLIEWLARTVADPTLGVAHDEQLGYSFRPPEGGSRSGVPRSPKGSRPPRTTPAGEPPSEDDLVGAIATAFDATTTDENGNVIGGER
jgi:hypothetical protein